MKQRFRNFVEIWRDVVGGWRRERHWKRRQSEFHRTGTRYYGDGGTIYSTDYVDVELYQGKVVSVWFRCQPLAFKWVNVDSHRAKELSCMYAESHGRFGLHGVEVADVGHK